MERSLYITKYRNIGFSNSKNSKSERIVLNHSLKKGEMGNLVIVIGANNSGKSNVLDAIYNFGQKSITERDLTTLSYEEENQKPQLTLVCKDNKDEYKYELNYKTNSQIAFPEQYNKININENDLLSLSKEIETLKSLLDQYLYAESELQTYIDQCNEIIELMDKKSINLTQIDTKLKFLMLQLVTRANHGYFSYVWRNFIDNYPNGFLMTHYKNAPSATDTLNKIYYERYEMPFLPQIIRYAEEFITNDKICCTPDNLENSKFFKSVFEKIGISISQIKNTYTAFHKQNNKGALTHLERSINKKLDIISEDFNKLYFADNDSYKFEINLESAKIFFSIFRGESDLSLDYQSTGFKWFFNLYFNLLCKTTLNPGDIIIMDEPAMNLHPRGQIELRRFLKEFAMKNDLTIVLATHSPFLIDLDYLDEIRVVANNDNISSIYNDFSTINMNDPDSLKPIKEALTVGNHVLYDPDKTVIFVEGITDYNYLLAFRNILNIDKDIIFLPIEGIGDVKSAGFKTKQLEISKELIKIKKHNPILLVDGDGAGKSMEKINHDDSDLTVIKLSDINPNFLTIESLFSQSDQEKYHIAKKNGKFIKSSTGSALIKTYYSNNKFDDETLSNFKSVFDALLNL